MASRKLHLYKNKQKTAAEQAVLAENEVHKVIVDQLQQRFKSLYGNEEYADLIIECGERTFAVHKAVVCTGCEFFHAACKNGEDGAFKESLENTITLNDNEKKGGDDPEIVALVLEYLYCIDYALKHQDQMALQSPSVEDDDTLTTHPKVFAAADKYDISGLKVLAQHKVNQYLTKTKSSPLDLAQAIRVVFTSTPEPATELRMALEQYLVNVDEDMTDLVEVQQAVESVHGLGLALFKRSKKKMLKQTSENCY